MTHLKSMVNNMINDKTEQASLDLHNFVKQKIQEAVGLTEAKLDVSGAKGVEINFTLGWKMWDDYDDKFSGRDERDATVLIKCPEAEIAELIKKCKVDWKETDLSNISDYLAADTFDLNSEERQTVTVKKLKFIPGNADDGGYDAIFDSYEDCMKAAESV